MIGFVVPLKPKANSKNWEQDLNLLEKTLRSICNQTKDKYRVYVISHDLPQIQFKHPNLYFNLLPYPYAQFLDINIDGVLGNFEENGIEKGFDQGRKTMYGSKLAIEDGCNYIMSVDADDLISNRIASYVNDNPNNDGWYVDQGYIYSTKSKILINQKHKMNHINGSTHIIAAKHIIVPDFNDNIHINYNFFAAHSYLRYRLLESNIEIKAIPFPAVIYIAHDNNWLNISKSANSLSLKNIIKTILRYSRKTEKLKKEFLLNE